MSKTLTYKADVLTLAHLLAQGVNSGMPPEQFVLMQMAAADCPVALNPETGRHEYEDGYDRGCVFSPDDNSYHFHWRKADG